MSKCGEAALFRWSQNLLAIGSFLQCTHEWQSWIGSSDGALFLSAKSDVDVTILGSLMNGGSKVDRHWVSYQSNLSLDLKWWLGISDLCWPVALLSFLSPLFVEVQVILLQRVWLLYCTGLLISLFVFDDGAVLYLLAFGVIQTLSYLCRFSSFSS